MLLNVQNVGYELMLPLSSLTLLPGVGESCSVWVLTHVREDAIRLFGFVDPFDRKVFECLLSVSNVGPKLALALLGPLTGRDVVEVIGTGRADILVQIPGVGARTADRLIVELRDKVVKIRERYLKATPSRVGASGAATVSTGTLLGNNAGELFQKGVNDGFIVWDEVKSALLNLGYKEKQINDVIKKLHDQERQGVLLGLEDALRAALKALSHAAGFTRSGPDSAVAKM